MPNAGNQGPQFGPMVWLMAVLVTALADKASNLLAGLVLLAICLYAIHADHRNRS